MSRAIEMLRQMAAGLFSGLDTKRATAWHEYGYPSDLKAADFYKAYQRHGIAFGAVDKLNGACWATDPWIIEGEAQDEKRKETAWELAVKKALPDDFWYQFAEADKRRLVGRYAALVLLLRDSKPLNAPVDGGKKLLDAVVPVWESALKVQSTDAETGVPTMYQYTDINNKQHEVHPDRVIILGDMSAGAVGFLEPAYNNIVNLEKIEGGSGESYLKNASRQPHINFDKEVNLQQLAAMVGAKDPSGIQEKVDEVAQGLAQGIDKALVTQGATATMLTANVPDPKPHYEINVNTAAAAWDIPAKILVGNQTGERASTEDQKHWAARCQSRRVRVLSREIKACMLQLQRVGVLPPMQVFTVMWDDLRTPTAQERMQIGKVMAEINSTAMATGAPIYDDDEIRAATGYEAKVDAGVERGEEEEVDGEEA